MSYTLWQAVTNFATTANGVLASTFLLYSVGLGAGAIPTAGALNWVLKDGLGQLGTLLFGKAIAHNFDIHSKTWYFMSFLLLSTATGGFWWLGVKLWILGAFRFWTVFGLGYWHPQQDVVL
jgi:hypothetical protein